MAVDHDGGIIGLYEQWFADQLAALQHETKTVFKKAEKWRHQVGPTKAGIEAWGRHSPFAFVSYHPDYPGREADDLRQSLQFVVFIGRTSKKDGQARYGSATLLGISKIRDLVIDLFDDVHPGDGFTCDHFHYNGEEEVLEAPRKYGLVLFFKANYMT